MQDELKRFKTTSRAILFACPALGDLLHRLCDEQINACVSLTARFKEFLETSRGGSLTASDRYYLHAHDTANESVCYVLMTLWAVIEVTQKNFVERRDAKAALSSQYSV